MKFIPLSYPTPNDTASFPAAKLLDFSLTKMSSHPHQNLTATETASSLFWNNLKKCNISAKMSMDQTKKQSESTKENLDKRTKETKLAMILQSN